MELHTLPDNFEKIDFWLSMSSFFLLFLSFSFYMAVIVFIGRLIRTNVKNIYIIRFFDDDWYSVPFVIITLTLGFATFPLISSFTNSYFVKHCAPIRADKMTYDYVNWNVYEKCELDNTNKEIVDQVGYNKNYIGDKFENYDLCKEHIAGKNNRIEFLLGFTREEITEYSERCENR